MNNLKLFKATIKNKNKLKKGIEQLANLLKNINKTIQSKWPLQGNGMAVISKTIGLKIFDGLKIQTPRWPLTYLPTIPFIRDVNVISGW